MTLITDLLKPEKAVGKVVDTVLSRLPTAPHLPQVPIIGDLFGTTELRPESPKTTESSGQK
ncbi:hypothetical protein A2Z33_01975 [Candidatus Gottesmanbacteria bacterium RBG_16_52_11]|uniref:Uncharacterized protein n=1 Tax=Candidatus Gottesmanbacteria bacterium RBG_16_52_11 TaxID=1798374 RepID=A0A1F5YRN7_9BACT|nr:MAG: hypothetical protein A2Z33_01975 [Candidatus Gottesmanbacteria bacterium RBG_16_52_11]